MSRAKPLGFWSIVSIGIGGMVGGGIFAVLGLAVQMAGGATPVAFALGGIIALLTSYSYAKLSLTYPGMGGTVEYLGRAFGSGIMVGALNILLWLSYMVMLSLYAYAFGSYGASFFSGNTFLWKHLLTSLIVVLLTLLNAISTKLMGEAEEFIVAFKISILVVFVTAGMWSVDKQRLVTDIPSPLNLITGGMIIFLAYEGFELIANTSGDAKNPDKIPMAYYISILSVMVLYITIAIVAVGNLDINEIISAEDYALAVAARPFLGNLGFVLVAVAAMLSTSSAINATLYGASRVSYIIAKEGELPEFLEHKVWNRPLEGLLISAVITLVISNLFNLSGISVMGSAGFLLIFLAVNLASFRQHRVTGGNRWVSIAGAAGCAIALGILIYNSAITSFSNSMVLIALFTIPFVVELVYRKLTQREISVTKNS